MCVHSSQSKMSAELLLPVQHVVCYLSEVPVHSLMVPVQLLLQVRADTGREDTGRENTGREDTGRENTGREDTGREGHWQGGTLAGRTLAGRDTGREDTGRGGHWQGGHWQGGTLAGRDTGREDTGREDTGREDTGREGQHISCKERKIDIKYTANISYSQLPSELDEVGPVALLDPVKTGVRMGGGEVMHGHK
jgi:hypothetical protein